MHYAWQTSRIWWRHRRARQANQKWKTGRSGTPRKKWLFYRSFTWFLYQSDIFAEYPSPVFGSNFWPCRACFRVRVGTFIYIHAGYSWTPKKKGQIRFISDFWQLNKWIICQPYPMWSTHKLFKCFEGFTYCTALDFNMGFWTIPIDKCTFTTPVHDHLTLGTVLLSPSSNGTSLLTGHIPRENVRTIHPHDLHHCLSRWHTCTYLQFLWWSPTTTWKCFQITKSQQPSSQH